MVKDSLSLVHTITIQGVPNGILLLIGPYVVFQTDDQED